MTTRLGPARLGALLTAMALFGCGGESGPGADAGTDTDGDGSSTGEGSTSNGETTAPGSTGGSADGSTGQVDETGSTGDADTGTTGADEESPYRIVFSDAAGGTVRLYSATPDFEQIDGLTTVGVTSVDVDGSWTSPKLHANGRHLAFQRGDYLYAVDVWTTESAELAFNGTPLVRFSWSPVEPELAWLSENKLLRKVTADGSETSEIFDLTGDNEPIGSMFWEWGPLGDRFSMHSRPDGAATTKLWAFDADGSNWGIVGDPISGIPTWVDWTPDGEALTFVADVTADYPGGELCLGERDGYEVISHPSGGVMQVARSKDGSRLVYLATSGLFSVNVDGTDLTLIEGAAPAEPGTSLAVNDDGTWAAREYQGKLVATPTTLHVPTEFDDAGADGRTMKFEPGGARLAYLDQPDPQATQTLRRVDANGAAEVSHALGEGENVSSFMWAGDGLRYVVADPDQEGGRGL